MKSIATDNLLPLVRSGIQFETLLKQGLDAIKDYAARTWSDTGEHDPGVTLLQAYCYGVADLSYRCTLPLTDLLTPAPDQQVPGGGLFPREFGPQMALTCGPITPDDYRRALLDLCGAEGSNFFFRNAQMVPLQPSDYRYWYDSYTRTFNFVKPSPTDGSSPVSFDLRGNYKLYLEPSGDTQVGDTQAATELENFLTDNRNLCEAVTQIVWLQPQEINPEIAIDLDADVQDVAALLAEIYTAIDAYIYPVAARYTIDALLQKGLDVEAIYDGPYLSHGWIADLPAAMDYSEAVTVDLSGLASTLLAIDGVRSIESICSDRTDSWVWTAQGAGFYPQLWGDDPIRTMIEQQYVRLISAGGELVTATPEDVEANLPARRVIDNTPEIVPYGKWRDPGQYHPASDKIPPCYGLQQLQPGAPQWQLYQFVLPFEQNVANLCAQLAMLPALLSFVRTGDTVWGEQWPYADGSIGDNVHKAYSSQLIEQMRNRIGDYRQELSIVNDLLGYFGGQCSARMLATSENEFLDVQQAYLAQHTKLGYERNNIRIDKVSALQKRIAARLGMGSKLFDPDCAMSDIEFYLVEHRALLPVIPDPAYDQKLHPQSATADKDNDRLDIVAAPGTLDKLKVGQLVDLAGIAEDKSGTDLRIPALIVESVDTKNSSFSVELNENPQLYVQIDKVLAAQKAGTLYWQNSQVWLQDIDYPLNYAKDQGGLDPNSKRLGIAGSNSFPVIVKVNDKLRIRPNLQNRASNLDTDDARQLDVVVTAIDAIGGTLTVRIANNDEGSFPADGEEANYYWYSLASTDRFSFAVSLIFSKSMLPANGDVYGTDAWVKQTAQQELPVNVHAAIHWMDEATFTNFANSYGVWQSKRTVQSNATFQLLQMLALGRAPLSPSGIGSQRIADSDQRAAAIGSNGSEWNVDVIAAESLFFVPTFKTS